MDFGEKLRLVRKERGITQEELAEQLQVSRQAISKWEAEFPQVKETATKPTLTMLPKSKHGGMNL